MHHHLLNHHKFEDTNLEEQLLPDPDLDEPHDKMGLHHDHLPVPP